VLPAPTPEPLQAMYGVRWLRESLIAIDTPDLVRMAEFKGFSDARVLWRHVLPNALIRWMNAMALNIGFIIGGVVVAAAIFILVSLLADIGAGIANPRLRVAILVMH
jgi:peptide/nickel transport system permease protein